MISQKSIFEICSNKLSPNDSEATSFCYSGKEISFACYQLQYFWNVDFILNFYYWSPNVIFFIKYGVQLDLKREMVQICFSCSSCSHSMSVLGFFFNEIATQIKVSWNKILNDSREARLKGLIGSGPWWKKTWNYHGNFSSW